MGPPPVCTISNMWNKDTKSRAQSQPAIFLQVAPAICIRSGQARLDDAENEEQSQARLLGFTETQYLQRSASEAKYKELSVTVKKKSLKLKFHANPQPVAIERQVIRAHIALWFGTQ